MIHQNIDENICTAVEFLQITLLVVVLFALSLLFCAWYFETTVLLLLEKIGVTMLPLTAMLVLLLLQLFVVIVWKKMVEAVFGLLTHMWSSGEEYLLEENVRSSGEEYV